MATHITAAKDLYLDADQTKAVDEGPDAAFLLARKGRLVPAKYHGLVTSKGHPKGKARKPGGDKARKPGGDKGGD